MKRLKAKVIVHKRLGWYFATKKRNVYGISYWTQEIYNAKKYASTLTGAERLAKDLKMLRDAGAEVRVKTYE